MDKTKSDLNKKITILIGVSILLAVIMAVINLGVIGDTIGFILYAMPAIVLDFDFYALSLFIEGILYILILLIPLMVIIFVLKNSYKNALGIFVAYYIFASLSSILNLIQWHFYMGWELILIAFFPILLVVLLILFMAKKIPMVIVLSGYFLIKVGEYIFYSYLREVIRWRALIEVVLFIGLIFSTILLSHLKEKMDLENRANQEEISGAGGGILKKNIALYIFLTIITFGVYGIVWLAEIVQDLHKLHGDDNSVTGEVLLILLVPFYGYYWMYKSGKQMQEDMQKYGEKTENNGVAYMLLTLFFLSIIAYALIQSELNNFASKKVTMGGVAHNEEREFSHTYHTESIADSLEQLKKIKEMELITEEEFEQKRKDILSRL